MITFRLPDVSTESLEAHGHMRAHAHTHTRLDEHLHRRDSLQSPWEIVALPI